MQQAIEQIQQQFPELNYSVITVPDKQSLNDFFITYQSHGLFELLNEKQSFPDAIIQPEVKNAITSYTKPREASFSAEEPVTPEASLTIYNSQKIGFQGLAGFYFVLGDLSPDMGSLKITLQLEEPETRRKHTNKLDLFEAEQVQSYCTELSEKHRLNANLIETDLFSLRDLLAEHRDKLTERIEAEQNPNQHTNPLTPLKEQNAIAFLSEKNLLKRIDKVIEKAGVIGEEKVRILLFISATTYNTMPLHVLVQGSSGSGKSHLINTIKDCIPNDCVINLTRMTDKSMYNFQNNELVNKLMVVQDFDGLNEVAQFALREAQSSGQLNSSTVIKDKLGNQQSVIRKVKAHFSSMIATTQAEVYYDNMSRSIIIGVDESEEQTLRIMANQNKKYTGEIDNEEQQEAKMLLQNCLRVLKPYKVINPFADKIYLPVEAKMLRRLNEQFQLFVLQVAFLNQYQRTIDDKGRVIATLEDLKTATELFFEAIILKVDELDSGTRQFFERLKAYVKKQTNNPSGKFSQRDIRLALHISKSQCHRYFDELHRLEYVAVSEGSANRGYQYKVAYWDDMEKIKSKIKAGLMTQINQLKQ
jgi:ABC-type dipeptide/oligopeptide/nickel transport system ATPase component